MKLAPLPCPFCGCNDIFIGRGNATRIPNNAGAWGYVAVCNASKCHAIVHGPSLPYKFHKRPGSIQLQYPFAINQTIRKWNKRLPGWK